ncbi:Flavin-containing monooxygenase FMO GS-OX 9 [Spatholobus suberectus]|nr:Flavin-containing monooxygenase FMO GS-OX 9 [Spatholobus suberectus]
MVSEANQSKNVCAIGVGPSRLVVAKELRREGHMVVVLEQNYDIRGQWLYDLNVEGEDPLGRNPLLKVHRSIYKSLRLMSPREVMGFIDFPFLVKKGRDARRFPSYRELFLYLEDFCEWFWLKEMIRFNTKVVRNKEKKSEEIVEQVFDVVVMATGHFSKPRLPSIQDHLQLDLDHNIFNSPSVTTSLAWPKSQHLRPSLDHNIFSFTLATTSLALLWVNLTMSIPIGRDGDGEQGLVKLRMMVDGRRKTK